MRRSTTFVAISPPGSSPPVSRSAANKRLLLGVLLTELVCAVMLVGRPAAPPGPQVAAPAVLNSPQAPAPASTMLTMHDGRSVELVGLGGERTAPLLRRIAGELGAAVDAVTAFWGPDWRRDIVVVATRSDDQFRALAGSGPDIAAATTSARILFAPGAAAMSQDALRIVLRHELFHYAARAATAADAPRWLTEGVADYVARPPGPPPAGADALAALPTDADLDTAGPVRSLAYDRAWWFSSYVAERYGTTALRTLYLTACGAGHPDVATAVRQTLGTGLDDVLAGWRQWPAR